LQASQAESEENVLKPGAFAGVGAAECSYLIELDKAGADTSTVVSWVIGFWSGMNLFFSTNDTPQRDIWTASQDLVSLEAMIVGRCYEDPNELIVNAAGKIFQTMPEIGGTE
jgi:hypothetical protein